MPKDIKQLNICVVDDEEIVRVSIADDLSDAGHNVTAFGNPVDALAYLQNSNADVVITDIKMPKMNGIEFLKKIKEIKPSVFVIMMTAFGSVKSAVEAMKLGAFDYLSKPFEQDELTLLLKKIDEIKNLRKINREFSRQFQDKYNSEAYYGESKFVEETRNSIKMVAETNSSVLITGETGTGKELIANIIHYSSKRKNKPLIKVSCAVLSKDIFESELFGHVKGAFTGADKDRIGRFEEADGGTIYLDDIDDVPLDLQVKLLRVLQENEIERLGSNKPIKIDVRVIASSKKQLLQLVEEGKFREDLYYRLNVWPIHLKPLRERPEDIPIIFNHFIKQFYGNENIEIEPDVYEILKNYHWPGNTRELKNLAERLVILARDGKIDAQKIPLEFCQGMTNKSDIDFTNLSHNGLTSVVDDFEIRIIKSALAKSGGNKNKAAELLKIPVSTLRSKIEKFNL